MENNWSVYKHTSPDDSVYYGITSGKPEERWANGLHYEKQRRFFVKIVKYGWENIKHEVLASGLDENNARRIESELIRATPYEKCCNTAFNVNPNPPQKQVFKWYDDEVTTSVYASKFESEFSDSMFSLADDWRGKYLLSESVFPYSARIEKGKIELCYMYNDDDYTYFETRCLEVPVGLHTYLDYWNYLQEPHDIVLMKREKRSNEEFQRLIDEMKSYA